MYFCRKHGIYKIAQLLGYTPLPFPLSNCDWEVVSGARKGCSQNLIGLQIKPKAFIIYKRPISKPQNYPQVATRLPHG